MCAHTFSAEHGAKKKRKIITVIRCANGRRRAEHDGRRGAPRRERERESDGKSKLENADDNLAEKLATASDAGEMRAERESRAGERRKFADNDDCAFRRIGLRVSSVALAKSTDRPTISARERDSPSDGENAMSRRL